MMTVGRSQERRRYPRVPMAKPVRIDVEQKGTVTLRAELLDLSLGGLRCSGPLKGIGAGTRITVTLDVPGLVGTRSLRLPAVILRSGGDPTVASASWNAENGSQPAGRGLRSYLRRAQKAYEDLVARQGAPSQLAESLRMLQVNLGPSEEGKVRQVLITSAVPAEGKSFIAGNLAVQLAHDGNRVLLVEADIRQPSLHDTFGVRPAAGLAQWLENPRRGDLSEITFRTGVGVDLIVAGTTDQRGDSWTRSSANHLVGALRKTGYQFVIIDSPPVLLSAATLGLASMVDDVLLVVRAGISRERDVLEARTILERGGASLRGLVLNDEPSRQGPYGGGYYGRRGRLLGSTDRHRSTGEAPSRLRGALRA